MYNTDNYLAQSGGDPIVCQQIDSAVFLFSTLLVDFKNPIQNQDRVPALGTELLIKSQAFL